MTRLVLVAGGTGTLGRELLPLLMQASLRVRLLTRDPARVGDLAGDQVETVAGDVRHPATLDAALDGVETVVSAMSGYGPRSGGDPRSVDWLGNSNLIRAAERARVGTFILLSALGAAPGHPMELMRMKYRAEQELKSSRLAWTIIRPALYMETLAETLGEPLSRGGKALIPGRGENPINFVCARDVAYLVERAVLDPALRAVEIDIGGPENLTLKQFAATIAVAMGTAYSRVQIPRFAIRLVATLATPINRAAARLAHDLVVMDAYDFTFDPAPFRARYPWAHLTPLADMLTRRQAATAGLDLRSD